SIVEVKRERKSVGKERTFQKDIRRDDEVLQFLRYISAEVLSALHKKEMQGKTVVLKVRYSDFETHTRRKTMLNYIHNDEVLFAIVNSLWQEIIEADREIRLL